MRRGNAGRMLLNRMYGGINHANGDGGDAVVTDAVVPVVTAPKLITVGQGAYNPPFKAQIQTDILKKYYSVAAGVYTEIAAAAVPAALQQSLPAFLFATADFGAGYAKLQSQFPLQAWSYGAPVVFGKDYPFSAQGVWDATVINNLRNGDVVLPFTATSGGTDYTALVIIRTGDVPYATLLQACNSNTFKINLLRYKVNSGQEVQFANAILATNETMFGKFTADSINPEAYVNPEQQQDNIADIDIEFDVNKQKGLATLANYDVVTFRWNLFIASATKIV